METERRNPIHLFYGIESEITLACRCGCAACWSLEWRRLTERHRRYVMLVKAIIEPLLYVCIYVYRYVCVFIGMCDTLSYRSAGTFSVPCREGQIKWRWKCEQKLVAWALLKLVVVIEYKMFSSPKGMLSLHACCGSVFVLSNS